MRPSTRIAALGGLLALIIGIKFVVPVRSYSITGAVQKLTVYDGVMTVSTFAGSTGPILEFGVDGTSAIDIASSSPDIVFRPNSSNTTTTKFSGGTGNVQHFTLSGDLVLATSGKSLCLKTACRTNWIGGLENWVEKTVNGSFTHTFIEPIGIENGVRVGDSTNPVTTGTAVTADGLYVTNRGGGTAAEFNGNVTDIANLIATKGIFINNLQVFSQWNDGRGTGVDADRLDGMDATLRNGYACDSAACLCVTGQTANHPAVRTDDLLCIRLFASTSQEAPY